MSVSIPQDLVNRITLAMDSKSKEFLHKALSSLYEEINNSLAKHRYLLINIIEGEHSQDRIAAIIAKITLKRASLGYMPNSLQESYNDALDASEQMSKCIVTAREQSRALLTGIKTLTEAANALKQFTDIVE